MTEDQLEQAALGWLADVANHHRHGPELAPDGSTPKRRPLFWPLKPQTCHASRWTAP